MNASHAWVAVVGSVNMDLVFNTERMPAPGETLAASAYRQEPGGKGANQAVAAAREGASVCIIGHVGEDDFGALLRQTLAMDDIDVSHLTAVAGERSGVAAITVDASGQNSILVAAGANGRLNAACVRALASVIDTAGVLVCQLETPLDSVVEAVRIAHDAGVPVVFNPAPVCTLPPELLARVDYLVVNEHEARELTGIDAADEAGARRAAHALRAAGAGAVLVTLGARGVHVSSVENDTLLPAIAVRAVDTTAAGDTFVGSFAVAIAQGASVLEAASRARYAAALTVQRPGAQCSIPLRAEIDLFVARQRAGSGTCVAR